MIYGKIWLVVKPSTGIPLFLSAVAIGSFLVHFMLLSNTTWVPRFLNGPPPAPKAAMAEAPPQVAAAPTAPKQ